MIDNKQNDGFIDPLSDVTEIGHHGNGDYEIQISDDINLEYITSLIKDAYSKIKERN